MIWAAWATTLSRQWPRALLFVLMAVYLAATLPNLADFPVMEWAQMRIVEPAYKLATQGIYGNDLLTGFFNSENRYFEFMPLYPVLVALAYKLFGAGLWQARIVSVFGGLLVLVLTFRLGRRLGGARVGALAALALIGLRLGLPMPSEVDRIGIDVNASGMPLLDLARVIRFDIWVPVWALGASGAFLWAYPRRSPWGCLACGALAGLATLTHLYGAFILAVFGVVVLWVEGRRAWRGTSLYTLAAGWLLALLPWGAYAAGDLDAYRGQMLKHASLFAVYDPAFYVDNALHEPWRYLSWLGGSFRHPVLWPRAGLWVLAAGVMTAAVLLWRRARRGGRLQDIFLLAAWPVLAGLMALLLHYKRYYYVMLLVPFLVLQVAYAANWLWNWAGRRRSLVRDAMVMAFAATLVEAGGGLNHNWQSARAITPYREVTDTLRAALPPGARLVMAEPFWLGLTDYAARSIHLALLMADPRYSSDPPSIEQALAALRPDYVVSEERLLDQYARGANTTGVERAEWQAVERFLETTCPAVVADLDAGTYGPVRVYRCDGLAAGAGMVQGP